MTDKEIIKELLQQRNMSQEELAKISGYKSQSNITGIINRGKVSMKVAIFVRLLEAMGYGLYVIDERQSAIPIKVTLNMQNEEN